MKKGTTLTGLTVLILFFQMPNYAEAREVHVSSVPELLSAIKNDTTILMAAGIFDLTAYVPIEPIVPGENSQFTPNARRIFEFPGVANNDQGLLIHNVHNLRIIGAGPDKTKLYHSHPYATIAIFHDSQGIMLQGLEIGHIPKHTNDFCSGGVITFRRSSNIQVESTVLFGSGIFGFSLDTVNGFQFLDSTVRECTNSIAIVHHSKNVLLDRSRFVKNVTSMAFFPISSNSRIRIRHSVIADNVVRHSGFYACHSPVFEVEGSSRLSVVDTAIQGNQADALMQGNTVQIRRSKITKNVFAPAETCRKHTR